MNSQIILIFAAMAAIFYLLILRPQQRAKRAKLEMAQALEEGGIAFRRIRPEPGRVGHRFQQRAARQRRATRTRTR